MVIAVLGYLAAIDTETDESSPRSPSKLEIKSLLVGESNEQWWPRFTVVDQRRANFHLRRR